MQWKCNRGQSVECPGEKEFPYLWELMGGTFHQDVAMYGDTLEKVMAQFRREVSQQMLTQAASDIKRFLAERPNDGQLNEDMGRYFLPDVRPEGWEPGITNWRQWLTRVYELLVETPHAINR